MGCSHTYDQVTDYYLVCKELWGEEEGCDFVGTIEISSCSGSSWYVECPQCRDGRDIEL